MTFIPPQAASARIPAQTTQRAFTTPASLTAPASLTTPTSSARSSRLSMMNPIPPEVVTQGPLLDAMGGFALNLMLWGYLTSRVMKLSSKVDASTQNPVARLGGEMLAAFTMLQAFQALSASAGHVGRMTDPFERFVFDDAQQVAKQHEASIGESMGERVLQDLQSKSPIDGSELIKQLPE